jgi:hypothetical protein
MIEFDKIDGLYSEAHRRIAEVIKDIFPSVRLMRLDALHPDFNPERPFALVDDPRSIGRDLPGYTIRTLRESEIDARLIAFLVENNMQDPDSKANRLAILEMAQKAVEAKREIEWLEERKDIMRSMMKSKKHEYRHNGKVLKK